MDCTHDNEVPQDLRAVLPLVRGKALVVGAVLGRPGSYFQRLARPRSDDGAAQAAMVSFLPSAAGSTRGWDELVPTHLNLVNESRHYAQPESNIFDLAQYAPVGSKTRTDRADAGILPGANASAVAELEAWPPLRRVCAMH